MSDKPTTKELSTKLYALGGPICIESAARLEALEAEVADYKSACDEPELAAVALRTCFERAKDYQRERDQLRAEVERLKAENEALRNTVRIAVTEMELGAMTAAWDRLRKLKAPPDDGHGQPFEDCNT